jgi:hypothetical protein
MAFLPSHHKLSEEWLIDCLSAARKALVEIITRFPKR